MPSLRSIGSDDPETTTLQRILGPSGPEDDDEKEIFDKFIAYTYDLDLALEKYGFRICREAWRRILKDREELYQEDHTGFVYRTVIRERAESVERARTEARENCDDDQEME